MSGPGGGQPDADRRRADLHRVFVPRRARLVGYSIAGAQLVVMIWIAVQMSGSARVGYTWFDRAAMVGLGLLIAAVLVGFARVTARPEDDALVVRNLLRTTRLDWAQVVAVSFGGGAPWVTLDLADGESLPVMAVQRADGAAAEHEARRLATLVALHSRTARDD